MFVPSEPEPTVRTTAWPPPGGRSRHRAAGDGSRMMWIAVAGAAVVVVVAGLTVAGAGDDQAGRSGPGAAVATTVDAGIPDVVEEPVTETPSATPTTSPTPTPSPSPRRANPTDLLAQLRSTVDGLVQQDQLPRGAGRELGNRLREVTDKLADGDVDKARERLRDFAARLVELRREGRAGEDDYAILAAGTTQLVQALPDR